MPPPKRGSFQNPKSSIKKQAVVDKENKTPIPELDAPITIPMSEFKNSNHIEIFGKSNGSLIDMMKMKK